MGTALQHNIGTFIALAASVLPQSAVAGTINGSAIDRFAKGHALSCVLHQVAGAVTGAPTAISIVTKLQHSADGSTWVDYLLLDGVTVAAAPALTAASADNYADIDLSSANRYVRAVTTITFTGGTTPAILVAASLALGGMDRLPAA